MFDRIGEKIEIIAKTIFGLGATVSGIIGLLFISLASEHEAPIFGFLGLFIIGFGCALSYASSLKLYGYGKIIENTTIIAEAIAENTDLGNSLVPHISRSSHTNSNIARVLDNVYISGSKDGKVEYKEKCKGCNLSISHYPCPYCGYGE